MHCLCIKSSCFFPLKIVSTIRVLWLQKFKWESSQALFTWQQFNTGPLLNFSMVGKSCNVWQDFTRDLLDSTAISVLPHKVHFVKFYSHDTIYQGTLTKLLLCEWGFGEAKTWLIDKEIQTIYHLVRTIPMYPQPRLVPCRQAFAFQNQWFHWIQWVYWINVSVSVFWLVRGDFWQFAIYIVTWM